MREQNIVKQEVSTEITQEKTQKSRSWIVGLTSFFYPAAKRVHDGNGDQRAAPGDRDWFTRCCFIRFEDFGCYSRGRDPHPDDGPGGRRLRRQSLRHLAHSIAARTAFVAMES